MADAIHKAEIDNEIRMMTESWARENAKWESLRQRDEQRDLAYRLQSEQRRHHEKMEDEAYKARKALEELQEKTK